MWDIWEAKMIQIERLQKKASMNDLPIQLLVRDMVVSITRNESQEKNIWAEKKLAYAFYSLRKINSLLGYTYRFENQ